MKKLFIYSLLLLLLSSCDKFLDVKPDDKVYEEEVFSNERGFTKALTGVYKTLTSRELYGYSMKFGVMDLMVGYWNVPTENSTSRDFINYNYNNTNNRAAIDNIWSKLYSAIHQTNIIISYLPNIEGRADYKLIAGEAYGLRGYLHLELLKVFGPVIKEEGMNAVAIPYYLTPKHVPEKFKTAQEVLTLIETDLQKSADLLKEDPIITNGRAANGNNMNVGDYSALRDRRGIRMNVYAAKALLARKALWAGELKVAYDRANALIDELKESKAVRLVEYSDVEGDVKDLRFSVENIFALYENNSYQIFQEYFQTNNNFTIAYDNNLDKIYEGGTGSDYDIRFNWGLGNYYYDYFSKFIASADEIPTLINYSAHELQLINLPELYFIAAEAKEQEDPARAVELLEEFRESRSIYDPIEYEGPAEVRNALIDEVRREYIGEGYLFSFLKRRYLPIPVTGKIVPAALAIYKFPIPQDEQLYNPKP